jgi:hypothetical protein
LLTKSLADFPPKVSASAAFSAYGTLTSNMRGCSASPSMVMPSQRACPELNASTGIPSSTVEPNITE